VRVRDDGEEEGEEVDDGEEEGVGKHGNKIPSLLPSSPTCQLQGPVPACLHPSNFYLRTS